LRYAVKIRETGGRVAALIRESFKDWVMNLILSRKTNRLAILFALALLVSSPALADGVMRGYATPHYTIYSQLSDENTWDIAHRLEAMHAYYAARFSNVYRPSNKPKRVFLYNNREDFVAAGGHPTMPGQSMGTFDGQGPKLMMIFNEDSIGAFMSSCPLLYHEGFHQFTATEIMGNSRRQWPLWLDEAYATTFNNITWTGDGWVNGHIRMEYAVSVISSAGSFIPMRNLLGISSRSWHRLTSQGRIWPIYMQGMMLVHFLHYADDGKYRPLIDEYVKQVSNGEDSTETIKKILGLQAEFDEWFRANADPHMTAGKYYEILTAMITSHVARAHACGQKFASGKDFMNKARRNRLKMPSHDSPNWLPDTLRQELLFYHSMLRESHNPFDIEITYPEGGGTPMVRVYQPRFALELQGNFELDSDGKVANVAVKYTKCVSLNLAEAKRVLGVLD